MGMFDYIKCRMPFPALPEGAPPINSDTEFQTKDTERQFMDHYEIHEDGSIWRENYNIEDRSEPNVKGPLRIVGMMTRTNKRMEIAEKMSPIAVIHFGNIVSHPTTGDRWDMDFAALVRNDVVTEIALINCKIAETKASYEAHLNEVADLLNHVGALGTMRNPRQDSRPQRGAWAPGVYMCQCIKCSTYFMGDKRAVNCADCAYKAEELEEPAGNAEVRRQKTKLGELAQALINSERPEWLISRCDYTGLERWLTEFLKPDDDSTEAEARREKIVSMAKDQQTDGEIEVDSDAEVSEGDDNGAYVQAWMWVDFAGTEFDKEKADTKP